MQDIMHVKNKVIQASLELASTKFWGDISLNQIIKKADVNEGDFHALFDDKDAILAAYDAQIDRQLADNLEGQFSDSETERDQLFDVLMERFDILNENRAAVISILNSVTLDPKQAVLSLPHLCKSMNRTLLVADIDLKGLKGALKVTALTGLYLKVLRDWVKDDSPDMAATMAALDKSLKTADEWVGRIPI